MGGVEGLRGERIEAVSGRAVEGAAADQGAVAGLGTGDAVAAQQGTAVAGDWLRGTAISTDDDGWGT